VAAARRHGVPQHKVVPWVRRKLGPSVVVVRFRGDGSLGCSVPCVLCQRELTRFDLKVHCFLGGTSTAAGGSDGEGGGAEAGGGDGGGGPRWFCGRMSDVGAPTPVLTAGQRRTLNLDPGPNRARKGRALPGGAPKADKKKKRAPRWPRC
jgi:hypothetical protein